MRSHLIPRSRASLLRTCAAGLTLALGGTLAALLPTGSAGAATPVPTVAGLKVLITNDDSARGLDSSFGTDGKGLYELRKALCAAGADVLVVAPWSQQSGAGARMTSP